MLMMFLVSLASHKSLSKIDFRVSKIWFQHALRQIESITSKHVTKLTFFYWLYAKEVPLDWLWVELDGILSTDTFKPLTSVNVGCVHRDTSYKWYATGDFDASTFATLLPQMYKKGVLTW